MSLGIGEFSLCHSENNEKRLEKFQMKIKVQKEAPKLIEYCAADEWPFNESIVCACI